MVPQSDHTMALFMMALLGICVSFGLQDCSSSCESFLNLPVASCHWTGVRFWTGEAVSSNAAHALLSNTYMYVYTYVQTHICIHTNIHIYIYTCICRNSMRIRATHTGSPPYLKSRMRVMGTHERLQPRGFIDILHIPSHIAHPTTSILLPG